MNVYALAPTWPVFSALRLAHEAWYNNTIQEYKELPKNQRPKWRCFRSHPPVSGAPQLYPKVNSDGVGTVASTLDQTGDFPISSVFTSEGLSKTLTLDSQATGGRLNIFGEYSQHRKITPYQPFSTQTADSIGYDELQDDLDLPLFEDVAEEGNIPPYEVAFDTHPRLIKVATLYNDDARRTSKWFDVPTGWLVINAPESGEYLNTQGICVEFAKGSYGGVKAEKITKFIFSKAKDKFLGVRP